MIPRFSLPRKPRYVLIKSEVDFFTLFERVQANYSHCFLLESLENHSYDSRYAVIGFAPRAIVSGKGHELIIDRRHFTVDNPYYTLRKIIPDNILSRNYAGGLVGYLSYEAANFFESSLNLRVHPHFDQFTFGMYCDGLIHDKATDEILYFYYDEDRRNQVEPLCKAMFAEMERDSLGVVFKGDELDSDEHRLAVETVKTEILAGNTFQCQVGMKTEYEIVGNPFAAYRVLRTVNPSPHMYYCKFDDKIVLGASPELLFRLRNGEMETYPLAGTTKRSADEIEDRRLARDLLNDPKERAEHNMLVDLHRNDLGRVARFGTVKVRRLKDIKKFSYVQHISSEIVGIIRPDEDMFSGLAAVFPAGTLSGAPKIESMKIIERLEKQPRGPYGGALGHFGFNGDATFAIPIRSLFISGKYAYTQTSGGVVYDSSPEGEFLEIERKLQAMNKVLKTFEISGKAR